MLKTGVGCLNDFSVSPSPLWTNLCFELGLNGSGLGLGGLGTKDLGPGLDNCFLLFYGAQGSVVL